MALILLRVSDARSARSAWAPDRWQLLGTGLSGGEGTTWQARYLGGLRAPLPRAVKMLRRPPGAAEDWPTAEDLRRWDDQLAVLRHLDPKRVVRLNSVSTGPPPHRRGHPDDTRPPAVYLEMEWLDGPTLDALARSRPATAATLPDRLRFIEQAAEAVADLHSRTPTGGNPALHRDLKPANCIVDSGRGHVLVDVSTLRGAVAFGMTFRRRGRRPRQSGWMRRRRRAGLVVERSAFDGYRFPREVIAVAVRWYLRYGLSYRDVEELLAERGVEVDHVTVYRWVQRFTPLFADAARPCRHATGDRWFVDETYVKVAGRWRYLYRAVDQYGQVIDVLMAEQRDTAAARRFFVQALRHGPAPAEVTTDKAPAYLRVLDELVPAALHVTEQYANNRVEADHGRLKARLRPMRGLKRLQSAAVIAAGHAFVQNLRRSHYELTTDVPPLHRLTAAFTELALAV